MRGSKHWTSTDERRRDDPEVAAVSLLAVDLAYWQQTILRGVGVLAAVLLPAGTIVYLYLFKMMSFMQSRLGPMEAGPYGSMQLLAEVGKFLQKEDLFPAGSDRRKEVRHVSRLRTLRRPARPGGPAGPGPRLGRRDGPDRLIRIRCRGRLSPPQPAAGR